MLNKDTNWEVYPSVEVAFGERLRSEGTVFFIEVNTEAAVNILEALQPEDAKPTGVHFKVVDGPIECSELAKAVDPEFRAAGTAGLNEDGTINVCISMEQTSVAVGRLELVNQYVGSTVVHELTHATDFSSKSALKRQSRHQKKVEGPFFERVYRKLLDNFIDRFGGEPLLEGDMLVTTPEMKGHRILTQEKARRLYYDSPFETRAYAAAEYYGEFPQVIDIIAY